MSGSAIYKDIKLELTNRSQEEGLVNGEQVRTYSLLVERTAGQRPAGTMT
jgi:hypothetical protein